MVCMKRQISRYRSSGGVLILRGSQLHNRSDSLCEWRRFYDLKGGPPVPVQDLPLQFPQDWGIKGVDKDFFSSLLLAQSSSDNLAGESAE